MPACSGRMTCVPINKRGGRAWPVFATGIERTGGGGITQCRIGPHSGACVAVVLVGQSRLTARVAVCSVCTAALTSAQRSRGLHLCLKVKHSTKTFSSCLYASLVSTLSDAFGWAY
eukprot:365222-Chlamydomonas_euryale.AAC.11